MPETAPQPSSPQPPVPPQSGPPRRGWPRRLLAIFVRGLLTLALLGMAGWIFLAIRISDRHQTPPRTIIAALIAGIPLLLVVILRRRRIGLILFLLTFLATLGWYFSIQPSHNRDWQTDVAILPYADFDGDLVHLHNVRNFDYRSETDFTPAYYDRTYDLSKLQSIDLILSYWAGPAIAHAMLCFNFDDGQHVDISIETRKEKGETYSAVEGFFRQYELIYLVADERDVIRLRTNYRGEQVHLYRLRASPEKCRYVFLDYLETVNAIHNHARFYNALTENCTTSIFAHLIGGPPPQPKFTLGVLLSGYSAKYAYENGALDHSVPFDELQKRSLINDLAIPADQAPDFSDRIRARVVAPQAPVKKS